MTSDMKRFVRMVETLLGHVNPSNVNERHAQQWFAVRDFIDNNRSAPSSARSAAIEECAKVVDAEAHEMFGDIVPGDEPGARMHKHAIGCLLSVAGDIRALDTPAAPGGEIARLTEECVTWKRRAEIQHSNAEKAMALCSEKEARADALQHQLDEALSGRNHYRIKADKSRQAQRKNHAGIVLWKERAEALAGEVEKLTAENDRLRAALANGPGECVYCKLPREDWSKCASGFPGCGRGDDAMLCPHVGAELAEMAKIEKLREALAPFAIAAPLIDAQHRHAGYHLVGSADFRRAATTLAETAP